MLTYTHKIAQLLGLGSCWIKMLELY